MPPSLELQRIVPSHAVQSDVSRTARVTSIQQTRRTSISSGVANLANTILGAGLLGLPSAFARCGWLAGGLLLLIFAAFSALGLHLLSSSADLTGRPSSLHSVAEKALPNLGLWIDLAVALKCFGVATSYLVVVGDLLPRALLPFGASGIFLERRFWSILAALAVSPLTFLSRIDALRHTSILALFAVAIITALVVAFALAGPSMPLLDACAGVARADCRGRIVAFTSGMSLLRALPIYTFAFTCHQNMVSISNEMAIGDSPCPGRVVTAIGVAELLALAQYLVVALAGYLTFGEHVASDVLASYPPSALVSGCRLLVAVLVTLSYPLQSHPARSCALSLLSACTSRRSVQPTDGASPAHRMSPAVDPSAVCTEVVSNETMAHTLADANAIIHGIGASSSARHDTGRAAIAQTSPGRPQCLAAVRMRAVVSITFLTSTTATAVLLDDLGLILSLVGATGSVVVSYLLPGACYYRLCTHQPRSWLRSAALLQFCVGCILLPVSLTLVLTKS